MSEQITKKYIQDKNEEEISKNIQYFEVYRKMVSQMAMDSEKEYS